MNFKNSKKYFKKSEKIIPALSQTFSKAPYSYVKNAYPVFLKSGKGSHVTDVDNNEFIDYVLGLGPVSLGYCYRPVDKAIRQQLKNGISFSMPHTLEVEFSEKLLQIIPNSEMVRFAKTGSDAVTACVRAARAYTKKNHILYTGHGGVWHDWFTAITSRNQGIPKFNNELISLFKYNDLNNLKKCFQRHEGEIAAIVMEPMWLDYPDENYFYEVKELAKKNNSLLIFDEVLTGFRLANGGGQELLDVEADLVAFGKAIGNGMPLGAITGKEEYMKKFNDIFYSTTYGGETLSLAAGIAVVNEFQSKEVIKHTWKMGQLLKNKINEIGKNSRVNLQWKGTPVRGSITVEHERPNLVKSIFLQECVKQGVLFGPGEALLCYSHTKKDILKTIELCADSLKKIDVAIETNSLEKMLHGEEMKTVMTF